MSFSASGFPGSCRRRHLTWRGSVPSTSTRASCLATAGRFPWPGRYATATASSASPGIAWTPSSTPARSSRRRRCRSRTTTSTIEQIGPKLTAGLVRAPAAGLRAGRGRGSRRPADRGGRHLGRALRRGLRRAWTGRSRRAKIHDQVRAWWLTFGMSEAKGPIAELNGERVKLVRDEPHRPGRRSAGRRVRRGHALDRRVRARRVVSALQVAIRAERCNKCLPLRLNRRS